jgi:hypothetical protein
MSLATEAMGPGTNAMASALSAGLETIDQKQTVAFTLYVKQILPLDGFVFWLKADQLLNPPSDLPLVLTVDGSLHHATINTQSEDENFSTQRIVFTAEDPVSSLSAMAPETLYMAEVDGYKYAFSSRSNWYRQADLYHYSGDAVYAALSDIVIDNIADLDLANRVVSNSMPIWLMFTHAKTASFANTWPLYPAYLLPDNMSPPYAAVNIDERQTRPIGAGKFYDAMGNRFQLVTDTVEISFYGVRNDAILDFIDAVVQYGLDNATTFGVMNSPVPGDMKRFQVEISAIAEKKTVTFQVCYYQSRLQAIALKYILSAYVGEFYASNDLPPLIGTGDSNGLLQNVQHGVVNPQFRGFGALRFVSSALSHALQTDVPWEIAFTPATVTGKLNYPLEEFLPWDGSRLRVHRMNDTFVVKIGITAIPDTLGGSLQIGVSPTPNASPFPNSTIMSFDDEIGSPQTISPVFAILASGPFFATGGAIVIKSTVPCTITGIALTVFPLTVNP